MMNSATSERSPASSALAEQPQDPLAASGPSNDGSISSHGSVNEQESGPVVDGEASAASKEFEEPPPPAREDLTERSTSLSEDLSGIEIQVPGLERTETGQSQRGSRRPYSESGQSISSSVLGQIIDSSLGGSEFPWEEQEDEDKSEKPSTNDLRTSWMTTRLMPSSSTTLLDESVRMKRQEQNLAVGVQLGASCTSAMGAGVSPEQTLQQETALQLEMQSPGAYACSPDESALQEDAAGTGDAVRADGSDTIDAEVVMSSQEWGTATAPPELPRSTTAAATLSNPGNLTSVNALSQALGSQEFFTTATAFQVDESQAEDEMRRRILSEAVEANVVVPPDEDDIPTRDKRPWKILFIFLALLLVVIGVAIILAVVLLDKDDDDISGQQPMFSGETFHQEQDFLTVPTMELVRKRGILRCGVTGTVPGFCYPNEETGVIEGLNVDYCRAISLAVLDNPNSVELVPILPKDRFIKLMDGSIDVMSTTATHTMERDVFESTSRSSFVFTVPFFYTGLVFSGLPEYVACADNLDSLYGDCRSTKACVIVGTTHHTLLGELLPGAKVVLANSTNDMVSDFVESKCHIIASEIPNIPLIRFRSLGYTGPFAHGNQMFSQEPLSIVTRKEDPEWSSLVGFIVNLLYTAESKNISKASARDLLSLFPVSEMNAKDEEMMAVAESIISEVGHYGDLYEKHLDDILPRRGANMLYQPQSLTGLIYNVPFGQVNKIKGQAPFSGSRLDIILEREYLLCGIPASNISGFAQKVNGTWSGLDIELCRALAAALFQDTDAVSFEELPWDNQTARLDMGDIDIVAGARVTLQAAYHGYAFSSPYHYENMDARALMTLDADSQFLDFVYWTVIAMGYAEEHGIGRNNAESMPVVTLFGEDLKQMFRDCILGVGSYGEVYNRTLGGSIPRSGGNLLNNGPSFGPQQFPIALF